jgi:xanthine dehydrogenase FAD-binding subunit
MVETYRPTDLAEAVVLRARAGALPFGGGTDLMVRYRYESGAVPDFGRPILFLDRIEELGCVERSGDFLRIGGAGSLTQVLRHPDTPGLLRQAVRSIAAPALRNSGTIAGNLCNASPAGDSVLALYALSAQIELAGCDGGGQESIRERVVAVEDFITGPGQTVLRDDELVSAILVPLEASAVSFFRKVGTRRANALTKVAIAGWASIEEGGSLGSREAVVEDIAVALGAVAPTVVRSREIEGRISGKSLGEIAERKEELIDSYGPFIRPIDDQRSTARYRRRVAMNLLWSFFEDHLLAGL